MLDPSEMSTLTRHIDACRKEASDKEGQVLIIILLSIILYVVYDMHTKISDLQTQIQSVTTSQLTEGQ